MNFKMMSKQARKLLIAKQKTLSSAGQHTNKLN
jgi:hypothetical protein